MARRRGAWRWALAGLVCAAAGCVAQTEYDSIARANLHLQDKLAASQADRVKARTQIAMLRQEVVQAKQAQQEANDRLQAATVETETLRSQLDLQGKRPARLTPLVQPAAQSQPAARSQPAVRPLLPPQSQPKAQSQPAVRSQTAAPSQQTVRSLPPATQPHR